MSTAPDDRTTAYVIEAHPAFEDLRQVAAQLAGLLVLAATGSRESSPHHPMLENATETWARATDAVKRSATLANARARPHHRHLVDASESLSAALTSCGAWPLDVDAALVPLRAAYGHLQAASKTLPGFQMVSFDQACCGYTSSTRTTATITAEHAKHAE